MRTMLTYKNKKNKMQAYKLFRKMKNGSIRSLFINNKVELPLDEWLDAECLPTPGFAVRFGWHCTAQPVAPHLSKKNRVWGLIEMDEYTELPRPEAQGGMWYLADRIKIIKILED